MICSTCAGHGSLNGMLHWTDCAPKCAREHAETCVSCMGSGRMSHRLTIGATGAQRLMVDLSRAMPTAITALVIERVVIDEAEVQP